MSGEEQITGQHLVPTYLEDEIKGSYIDYAMSVIVGRALPDVRDGLKPAHRRVLYAMHDIGLLPGKAYKKSAAVVGEVLGKYHPHGDASVYDTMVRMAQDFSLRYPLVDGQGNFGSVDGDSAAAYRYTEARLAPIAVEMLRDIEKETVDFIPTFDESHREPTVLPSLLPNLLVNGSAGIAVGMATNIPSHNLGEICDALVAMIDDPEIDTAGLMQHVTGPDFPTAAFIYGRSPIKDIYETGRGHLTIRVRINIETTKTGRDRIVVSEIPYQIIKTTIIERIADLVHEKKIEGISDLRDESDREGMRLIIELKKGAIPQIVLNQLYKHTSLQTTFGVIMLALVDGRPRVLTLREMLGYYLEHRKVVIARRTRYDLARAEERAHILEGLKIALANLDEVIAIIKQSKSPEVAQAALMQRFLLSELQTRAILTMQLQRLTNLEVRKIEDEYKQLIQLIEELKSILASERKMLAIIRAELVGLKEKYGDDRRTEIVDAEGEFAIEDLIADENVAITITHGGYIKRMPIDAYRSQRRGGVGLSGMDTKEEDFVEHIFTATTHSYILIFTDKGNCFWLKVYDIPSGARVARGKAIVNLLPLGSDDKITAFVPVRRFVDGRTLFMVTSGGVVKRTDLMAFSNPRKAGIRAITLRENDTLVEVVQTGGGDEVLIATRGGLAIRFPEQKVRLMGRTSTGVRGIRLQAGDCVVGMVRVTPTSNLLTATANGFGKQTPLTAYRITGRGGRGVKNIATSERNGEVVAVREVMPGDEIIVVTKGGITIRTVVNDIRLSGRAAQGVRLIRLADDDAVIDVARVVGETREKQEINGESAPAVAALSADELDDEVPVDDEEIADDAEDEGDAADADDAADDDGGKN